MICLRDLLSIWSAAWWRSHSQLELSSLDLQVAPTRVYILCIRGYCGIAYGLLVAGRIQIRAGVGTTGGALAALSSRPWLMARVIEYSRIAMAAARAAAAAHACMVWLMCVVVTYEVDS